MTIEMIALKREDIDLDTPLRLSVAASLAYPDGSMTASGLRREAIKGRLTIERTAGKDYTTLGAIAEMRKLCRQGANPQETHANPRVYGSNQHRAAFRATSPGKPSGSSRTVDTEKALAAAKAILSAPD